jgi:hypothetical protein
MPLRYKRLDKKEERLTQQILPKKVCQMSVKN